MDVPPPNPLFSIQQQAQIPPDVQAEYATQRTAEQRAEIERYLGSVAAANHVTWTSQGR